MPSEPDTIHKLDPHLTSVRQSLCGLEGNITLAINWEQVNCSECMEWEGTEYAQGPVLPIWERNPFGCLAVAIGIIIVITVVLTLAFG